jgi:hypothetical protein
VSNTDVDDEEAALDPTALLARTVNEWGPAEVA